ncbi:MAG: pitrilysin family protein [Sorangiineae bacterium]|nr:pitrilysin family protein [Polyangiaceae bacterium]MEB2324566.1 pitrilysin family protein [Sorangiineae bacterium]
MELPSFVPLTSTLASGVRASAISLPGLHSAMIEAHVRVGSRFETATDNGVSHFLEHMLYRGTARHPSAHELALAFEELGGSLDAATYVDHMTLGVSVPPENIARVLPIFAEVFRAPILGGLDTEKGIVREEILEGLDDDGLEIDADNLVRRLSFGDHPLGYPITGTLLHLERFDRGLLERHHAARFVGDATAVTIAGPIDPERVLPALEALFGDLPGGAPPDFDAPPPQAEARFSHVRHASSQTDLRVAFRAPGDHHADEPAVELLLRCLDDGMATRLYHELCDARGLCYDVSAAFEAYSDAGLLDIAAEAAPERAAAVLEKVLEVLRTLRDEGPSDTELSRVKERLGWQLRELMDSPSAVTDYVGFGRLTGSGRTPKERYETLCAVSRQDVRAAAERWLTRERLSVVAVGSASRRASDALARLVHRF